MKRKMDVESIYIELHERNGNKSIATALVA